MKDAYEKIIYLSQMITMGARDKDNDCIWSHLDELGDIIGEIGER